MTLHQAILQLCPTAVTVIGDVAYNAQGEALAYDAAEAQALVDANAYKEQRFRAYPSIEDQLDQIYHEGIDAWKATIAAVKQEYPKP